MGSSVFKLQRKKKERYQALIRVVGYPDKGKKFDTEKEANEWADAEMAAINDDRLMRGDPKATLPPSQRFEDEELAFTLELFWKQKATQQQKNVLPAIVTHMGKVNNIGPVKVGELTERWIEDYIALMRRTHTVRAAPYSYSTIFKQMILVKAAIKWRARRLEIKSVPEFNFSAKEMFPADWEVERERRLEKAEQSKLRQLFRAMKGRESFFWRLLMILAVETAARQSELIKATWSEITEIDGLCFWTIPKHHNKSRRARVVPLNTTAVRALRFLRRLADPNDPRLFHCFNSAGVVSKLFHDWVKECEIEDLRFHDLRHEGVPRFVLRERNFTVDEVMRIVGHRGKDMLDRYTNIRGDELAAKLMRRPPALSPARAKATIVLCDNAIVTSKECSNDDAFNLPGSGAHAN